ncbi:MAG: hypothetical protein WCX82_02840 [archaeon]|jgi:hypothetical protein
MFKKIKQWFNKSKTKPIPIVSYKDEQNKKTVDIKTRQSGNLELKRVSYKENGDHYFIIKKNNTVLSLSIEARTLLKRYPEIFKIVNGLLFNKSIENIETSKLKFNISKLNLPSNSSRNNVGVYKLTFLDKETNLRKEYFIKLGKKYDSGNYPSYNEFESQKILEAAGFNIIKPHFAIWGENVTNPKYKFNNIIVYDFTNLTNYEYALDNKLLSKEEINAINKKRSKANEFAQNNLGITDISTKGNIFYERLPSGEIKIYFTDSAKIWNGKI